MPGFIEEARQVRLSKDSDFHEISQLAIKNYYLIPYPGAPADPGMGVFRRLHGGLHVSSVALNIEMLIELYKKYKPELLRNPDGTNFTPQQIKLLKLTAIYHDSANTSEMAGDEREHAENFRRDMLSLGFSPDEVEPFAHAIQYKDGRRGRNYPPDPLESTTIIQKLLRDADTLDVIRVRSNFDPNYLHATRVFADCPACLQELSEIIQNHADTLAVFAGESSAVTQLHRECEFSDNCYLAVRDAERNMLLQHIVFECLKRGKTVSLDEIDLSQLTILDVYNRNNSPVVNGIIADLLRPREEKAKDAKLDQPDPVTYLLTHGGCFVRALRGTDIDNELRQLKENEEVLRRHQLPDSKSLSDYLEKQSDQEQVFTPQGFRWRPCTFVEAGMPINLFGGNIAVIIDPNPAKGTIAAHFYKTNAGSRTAAQGLFRYEYKTGPLKNKKHLTGIRNKFREMNRRREGVESDPNLHYFGLDQLDWSEVLSTYRNEGIAGIVVPTHDPEAAKDALLLRAKLGRPFRSFYRYSAATGFTLVSDSEIINQSRINQDPNTSRVEEVKTVLNQSIAPPADAIHISGFTDSRRNFTSPNSTFSLPVKTKTISCNLTGMNEEYAKKIRQAVRSLTKFHPIDLDSIDIISAISVKEDASLITVSIEILDLIDSAAKKKSINILEKFIETEVLDGIKSSLLEKSPHDDAILINQLTTTLSIEKINQIQNLSSKEDLSEKNPAKFQFAHPERKDVRCAAWVKAGKPVVEFHLPGGKTLTGETKLLPRIAKKYYQDQINDLNQVICNEREVKWLAQRGIRNLRLELVTLSGRNKSYLALGFDLLEKEKMDDAKVSLVELFGLQRSDKIKHCVEPSKVKLEDKAKDNKSTIFNNSVLFLAPDVQNLDLFKSRIANAMKLDVKTAPPEAAKSFEKTSVTHADNFFKDSTLPNKYINREAKGVTANEGFIAGGIKFYPNTKKQ
jgi:hypothetical protein